MKSVDSIKTAKDCYDEEQNPRPEEARILCFTS